MNDKRLKQVFSNIKYKCRKSKQSDFPFDVEFDERSFISWYNSKKEELNNRCAYCETDQNKISELIHTGKLKSKRFNKRGLNLEVDRKKPNENYSASNCTLICYFCNNDKSDIFSADDYLNNFIENSRLKNGKTIRCNFIDKLYETIN